MNWLTQWLGRREYWTSRGINVMRRPRRGSVKHTKRDNGSPASRAKRKTRRKMARMSRRRNARTR